jgi:hypothetical protein
MKLLNTNVCLTSRTSILLILGFLFSTVIIASIINPEPEIEVIVEEPVKAWEPTAEDIAFQDSMYSIIERTQLDLDTIMNGIDKILYKLEKFDYPDGTYDSIRYVIGGKIDKRRNK